LVEDGKALEDLQSTTSGVPALLHRRGGESLLSFFVPPKTIAAIL
jgi:hypothetical protein